MNWLEEHSLGVIAALSVLIALLSGFTAYDYFVNERQAGQLEGVKRVGPCRSAYRTAKDQGATPAEARLAARESRECRLQARLIAFVNDNRDPNRTAKQKQRSRRRANPENGGSSNGSTTPGGPTAPPAGPGDSGGDDRSDGGTGGGPSPAPAPDPDQPGPPPAPPGQPSQPAPPGTPLGDVVRGLGDTVRGVKDGVCGVGICLP